MGNVAHMHHQLCGGHLLQSCAEGRHQFGWQIGDETHRVRQNYIHAARQFHRAHCRIKRGEEHVLGQDLGPSHIVEQCGFTGIGIAHQRHDRIRHLRPCRSVQLTGFNNFVELLLQSHQLDINGPSV